MIEQVDNFNHYSLPVGAHEYAVSGGPMSAGMLSPPSSAGLHFVAVFPTYT